MNNEIQKGTEEKSISKFDKWYKKECERVFSIRINDWLPYFDNIPYKDIADILCKSDSWLQELRKKIIIQKLIPLMEN